MLTPENDRTNMALQEGQRVFGRYTLTQLLGRGGMGVVWQAHDAELDRVVALKFMPEMVTLDEEAIADLKRETKRCLELTHPNIVRVYDLVRDSRLAAIAMEYVDGTTLGALKNAQPRHCFDPEELSSLLPQLCDALTYAHEQAKVVHRDLKPSNVMITRNGVVKIADFGISATLCDSTTRITQHPPSAGTLSYASPQQLRGHKPSVADDVYALGATLYELLTGKPPFFRGNLLLQVEQETPVLMRLRRAEFEVPGKPIPQSWEEAVAACLSKDPAARPPSARRVLQLLAEPGSASGISQNAESRAREKSGAIPESPEADRTVRVSRVPQGITGFPSSSGRIHAAVICAYFALYMALYGILEAKGWAFMPRPRFFAVCLFAALLPWIALGWLKWPASPWAFRIVHMMPHLALIWLGGFFYTKISPLWAPFDVVRTLAWSYLILPLPALVLLFVRPRTEASARRLERSAAYLMAALVVLALLALVYPAFISRTGGYG